MSNPKKLVSGTTYRLWFKNDRSLTADYNLFDSDKNRYQFVVCDSAVLFAYDWDFYVQ